MGYAEFEEKEFEKPLYNQLENGRCNVWTPGQCLEGYIGFDYAGNINLPEFWEKFGGFAPKGVILNNYNMGYILHKIKKRKLFPDFSLNLFIQAKRPYIHSGSFSGSIYDIKHYSFEINKRQQKILEHLDYKLHHKALLVYASPVFGTYEELYKHTREETMISNTSFPKVRNLSGHSHWYYCNASEGIAHSEPEEDETIDIFELIEEFVKEENNNLANMTFDANLEFLSNTIIETLQSEFKDDFQVKFFFSQLQAIESIYEYPQYRISGIHHRTINSFLAVSIFCDIFNLDWFILQ